MMQATPSRTALRVALRRAAHQLHDAKPLVFDDPLAVPILGPAFHDELRRTPDGARRPFSAGLRAYVVTRARLAEDTLAAAIATHHTQQYLVLGAGLDTFACRNPYPALRVFEVDHPASHSWKQQMLAAANITPPPPAHFVPVDFERDSLRARLHAAGFDETLPTVTAWLGVVPYLTPDAFHATLRVLARFHPGSQIIFDYSLPRESLPPVEQLMLDSLSARVALAGEPFQLFFTPSQLAEQLDRLGLRIVEDLDADSLTARYLTNRSDHLALRGKAAHMCIAASTTPNP